MSPLSGKRHPGPQLTRAADIYVREMLSEAAWVCAPSGCGVFSALTASETADKSVTGKGSLCKPVVVVYENVPPQIKGRLPSTQ